jgi:hypothetical protein
MVIHGAPSLYLQLREKISQYESKDLSLHQLISNIEMVLSILQTDDPGWVRDFREQWSILESTYAVASYRGEPLESASHVEAIQGALRGMRNLIDIKELQPPP